MDDPRTTSPGSMMPGYSWLLTQKIDTNSVAARIAALRKVGVPYEQGYEQSAVADLRTQANKVVANLQTGSITAEPDREIIALIAYLQRIGTDIKTPAPPDVTPPIQTTVPPTPKQTAQLTTEERK
jgi:cytochrome c oxidase cbb3-type subunit I/II